MKDPTPISAHKPEFKAAIITFTKLARELLELVAAGKSKREENGYSYLLVGTLWEYEDDGDCLEFKHVDGTFVRVYGDLASDYGTLDPYYFHVFLSTSPQYKHLAELLPDDFSDTARLLDELESEGFLRRSNLYPIWHALA